ncbi:MAG TPA: serine hydrolase domain-containing protein [Stellaceae bacterium]
MDSDIDAVLARAVDAGDVPGVVALAATDRGVLYEGAFGMRDLGGSAAMTLDTIYRIASMTKAVTSVAAMQLVERGKLALDTPIGRTLPELANPLVLTGFDAAGKPRLRPAKRPITLRHLLTHTAGFGYEMLNGELMRYVAATKMPSPGTGKLAGLHLPLLFDPGEKWQYGINTDWVGRAIEAASGEPLDAYFRNHIFAPLGMTDSAFRLSAEENARLVRIHQRQANGSLVPVDMDLPPRDPEFWGGGGALYSTGPDYLRFLRMLLGKGELDGVRLLRAETVAEMGKNQVGELAAGVMRTVMPERTNDFVLFPEGSCRWGLAYMINGDPGPNGRSAKSLSWGGIFNSYYWIDPAKRVAGVILTQILPFADPQALALYAAFERAVYARMDRA